MQFVIQEYGTIYRQSDFVGLKNGLKNPNTLSELYLPNNVFQHLWNFAVEKQSSLPESNRLFLIQKKQGRDCIKVQNYVGVIETKQGIGIEILPKILSIDTIAETRQFLLKMLRALPNAPFVSFGNAHLRVCRFPLLEVFVNAFLKDLESLLQQGISRDYSAIAQNERFLKGKLLFKENLKENNIHAERFFVEYEQFSENTPLNKLLKATLLQLNTPLRNLENQSLLKKLLILFDRVEVSKNIEADFNKTHSLNRFYKSYKHLLDWAMIFLNKKAFTNLSGDQLGFSLLFPMERIFEAYLGVCLKKQITNGKIFLQHKKNYLIDNHIGLPKFNLRPDIVIVKKSADNANNNTEAHIIDAKWKLINEHKPKENYQLNQRDLYQLFAYGKKYLQSYDKVFLYLIYPKQTCFTQPLPLFKYDQMLDLQVLPFDFQRKTINDIIFS